MKFLRILKLSVLFAGHDAWNSATELRGGGGGGRLATSRLIRGTKSRNPCQNGL